MAKQNCDVLIVGGGLVGLSLAKGLELANISYRLIDKPLPTSFKQVRALALSKPSLAILNYLGVLAPLKPLMTPIKSVHVSCEGAIGQTLLEDDAQSLGAVVNLTDLNQILKSSFAHPEFLLNGSFEGFSEDGHHVELSIDGHQQRIVPKIVIAADGANSSVRQSLELPAEKAIEQTALLSVIKFSLAHQGMAFERFTEQGPMAFLPWGHDEMVLVWCLHPKEAEMLLGSNETQLKSLLQTKIGHRMGSITRVGALCSYPLRQVFMPKQIFKNVLFLGNAAHTLHPVAGQGFNLSLRDVAVLLDVLQKFGVSPQAFPMYLIQRTKDQRLTQLVTYFLAEQFNHIPKAWRGLGLGVIHGMPLFKKILSHYAQGFGYSLPTWVYQQMEHLYD